METMQIRVIIPVCTAMWNETVHQLLLPHKSANTKLSIGSLKAGLESLQFSFDEAYTQLPLLQEAIQAEKEGYDGIVVYCFADPALAALREALQIPVVGLCESSIHVASLLGERYSIILAGSRDEFPAKRNVVLQRIRRFGLEHKCASIRTLGIPVLRLEAVHAEVREELTRVARAVVEEDGADSIVLGCGGIVPRSGESLGLEGIPLIVPGLAALAMCEVLAHTRLLQSRWLYPLSPSRMRCLSYTKCDGSTP